MIISFYIGVYRVLVSCNRLFFFFVETNEKIIQKNKGKGNEKKVNIKFPWNEINSSLNIL
jgi:hypothetical protein